MAQPPIYTRAKDFVVDYSNETDHSAINNELDGAATSINAIRTNLALIQRDDGGLANGIVTADSIHPDFVDTLSAEINAELGVEFSELSLGQYFKESFVGGVDYTAGTSTEITLAGTPSSKANTTVHFDGVMQHQTEYELSGSVITFDAAIPVGVLQVEVGFANTLSEGLIGEGSVATVNLADEAVTTAKIDDLAVTTAKLNDLAVTEGKLGALSVTEGKIGAGAITADKVGALAITNAKLSLLAVEPGNLAEEAVTTSKLDDAVFNGLTAVSAALGDSVVIADVSDSGNKKRALISSLASLMQVGPAFSAVAASTQSVSSGVDTKVALGTEEFDTNSNFASSRFTPTVPGYYQINGNLYLEGTGMTSILSSIYKNGAYFCKGTQLSLTTGAIGALTLSVSVLIYLNGTTDYVEMYLNANGSSLSITGTGSLGDTRLSGFLARNP